MSLLVLIPGTMLLLCALAFAGETTERGRRWADEIGRVLFRD